MSDNTYTTDTTKGWEKVLKRKGCQVCGIELKTEEEKKLNWCNKHLDEFDRYAFRK